MFELLPVDVRRLVLCSPAQGAELLLRVSPVLCGERGLRRRTLLWLHMLLRRLLLFLLVPCVCQLRGRVLRVCPSPSVLPVFMRSPTDCSSCSLFLLRVSPAVSGSASVLDERSP